MNYFSSYVIKDSHPNSRKLIIFNKLISIAKKTVFLLNNLAFLLFFNVITMFFIKKKMTGTL